MTTAEQVIAKLVSEEKTVMEIIDHLREQVDEIAFPVDVSLSAMAGATTDALLLMAGLIGQIYEDPTLPSRVAEVYHLALAGELYNAAFAVTDGLVEITDEEE